MFPGEDGIVRKVHVTYKNPKQGEPAYIQFALSLGKESPYVFSKFNQLNTDTLLIRTPSMALSVSVLTGFDCILFVPALGVTSM